MAKFETGDKVYFPAAGGEIYTIKSIANKDFPIFIRPLHEFFTGNGMRNRSDKTSAIFFATDESYELLSKLHPEIEFAKPDSLPNPREVITKMLDDGWSTIVCLVSTSNRNLTDECDRPEDCDLTTAVINNVTGSCTPYKATTGASWKYAQPIDVKTGKRIVDYVDGEIVLGE